MSARSGGAKPRAGELRRKVVADNRRARFDYEILDTFEAGLVLVGSEVKALRQGRASLSDSYASVNDGELWLVNSHIPEFKQANRLNHEPRRARKLLLNKREIQRLSGGIQREGLTIVPLKVYFNDRGRAKAEIALARGKKQHDKRETEKQRSWQREMGRLLREKG
ncbi:MAG TPA: SsrA-binding protein SmpB [Aestuariivirgaceae bacterium]|nr:SsrA-binding protein SmpB [Aestuariivirgaceae bacterium]